MSLRLTPDGVRASITATVGSVEAEVEAGVKGVKAGVSGRLTPTTRYVPLRLGDFERTDGFIEGGMTYVDDGKKSYRLSLADIKKMNTKIVVVRDESEVDFSKLTVGDFIYEIEE